MSEHDANIELARRADLARRTGCHDRPDQHKESRGILNSILLGLILWAALFTAMMWGGI